VTVHTSSRILNLPIYAGNAELLAPSTPRGLSLL
jgi:hypothetical protein